jgi:uroporphyrinogen III methyltransferase/synthase
MSPNKSKAQPTLQGFRIVIISAADDPHTPAAQLSELEASLLFYPVSQMLPTQSEELDQALQRSRQGEIDWLLLTTPCAVQAVAERITHLKLATKELANIKIAAYGAKTALALAEKFPEWKNIIPQTNTHRQAVAAMQLGRGSRVLIPLALHSRANWVSLLQNTGAEVISVPSYRLIMGGGGDDLPGMLWGGFVDAILFLTENSVRHFSIRLSAEGGTLAMLDHVTIACFDPQTATAARTFGLHVDLVPTETTYPALTDALVLHLTVKTVKV